MNLPPPPVVAAYLIEPGRRDVVVFCWHCRAFHTHGRGDGHRVAHCPPCSPYHPCGYVLREVGSFTRAVRAQHHDDLVAGTQHRLRTGRRCTCPLDPTTADTPTELEGTDADDERSSSTLHSQSGHEHADNSASRTSHTLDIGAEAAAHGAGTAHRSRSTRDPTTRRAEPSATGRQVDDESTPAPTGGGRGAVETGTRAPSPPAPNPRERLHAQGTCRCGAPLPPPSPKGGRPRLRCPVCAADKGAGGRRWRAQNPAAVEEYNRRRRVGLVELVCSECHASFAGRRNRLTCSSACKRARHARLERERSK